MPPRDRLTNNSDETDIASLLSGDSIFSIPYFQRPYKWRKERVGQLNSDLLELVDESSDFHFLGAIIVHGRRSNPSDPDIYDVIDGQQRVTTLYLYLCAAVKFLADNDCVDQAAGLFLKYLAINRDTKTSNLKLHPGKDDRAQLNSVLDNILSNGALVSRLGGFRPKKLPTSGRGAAVGTLTKNYQLALDFFEQERSQGGMERVHSIYGYLLNKMSVVQIDVKDPTSGPKIFDSLNSRQEPMTVGDLIRNEIFSRIADEQPDYIERVDQDCWQPFYKKFEIEGKNVFDSYFFPFGLISNSNLQKSGVYGHLRKSWAEIGNPEEIVAELSTYQDEFLDLTDGSNRRNHKKRVAAALKRMSLLGAPTSTFPFLMRLSHQLAVGTVSEDDGLGVLEALESFLVRRAVCGIEPTGLHTVFKRLWAACEGEITRKRVAHEISSYQTVAWPGDNEFKSAIVSRPIYQTKIVKFIILEVDRAQGGDVPSDDPWIEHVLPQTPDASWRDLFSEKDSKELVDTLANLIPLSEQMNSSLGNRAYSTKRQRYKDDAMYKSARAFADRFGEWLPANVRERAAELADWATNRWCIAPTS
jgi:hypothetical protein